MIRNEVRVLKKICAQQHRNIVTFLDREGTLPQWGHYFDMELCDCNLHDYIQKQLSHLHHLQESRYFIKPDYDLDDVLHIMKDITCGLAFVHSHAEVHRDLKPRNGNHIYISRLITRSPLLPRVRRVEADRFRHNSSGNLKRIVPNAKCQRHTQL